MNRLSTGTAGWPSFLFSVIIRPLLTIILGIAVFVGVGLLMAERVLSTKLLNAEFYTGIITEHDTYNRIYDEILVDEEVRGISEEHLPIEVVSHEDLVMIIQGIAPPEYLREQVEGGINDTVDYFNEDAERLQIYLELGPALERVKPVFLAYIQQRIDEIPEDQPGEPECTPNRVKQLADRFMDIYREIAAGKEPDSIPSIVALSQPCRVFIFEAVYGASEIVTLLTGEALVEGASLGPRAVKGLQERREEIRSEVVAGDTGGALKAAVPPLVSPILDDGIERLRAELDDSDRIDLIDFLAESGGESTADEFRADMDESRQRLLQGMSRARTWTMLFLIGGPILMVLIYLPRLSAGLRWLGVTLAAAGGVSIGGCFVTAKILESVLPGRLEIPLEDVGGGVPPSLAALTSDFVASAARQLAQGAAEVAVIVLIAGAAALAASFIPLLYRRLMSGDRR